MNTHETSSTIETIDLILKHKDLQWSRWNEQTLQMHKKILKERTRAAVPKPKCLQLLQTGSWQRHCCFPYYRLSLSVLCSLLSYCATVWNWATEMRQYNCFDHFTHNLLFILVKNNPLALVSATSLWSFSYWQMSLSLLVWSLVHAPPCHISFFLCLTGREFYICFL